MAYCSIPPPEPEPPSPSEDRSNRFPEDARLRRRGWEIFERRNGREPLWRRKADGKVFTFAQALRIVLESPK